MKNKTNSKYFEYLSVILPKEFTNKVVTYKDIKRIRDLIFVDEYSWKALTEKERNLIFLYEYFILDLNKSAKIIEDKIVILYQDIFSVQNNNFIVTQFLLRVFKKFSFNEKKINENITALKKFRICERTLLIILKLLENEDWKGVIEKDIATILIDTLEFYNNTPLDNLIQSKNEKLKIKKLMYYVYYSISNNEIYREMLFFSKEKEKNNSIYKRFLQYFENKTVLIDSCLYDKEQPNETIQYDEISKLNKIFKFQSLKDLKEICGSKLEYGMRKMFEWKYNLHVGLSNESPNYFKNYINKEYHFIKLNEDARIHSELKYHEYSSIILEINDIINDIKLEYSKDDYFINTENMSLKQFSMLPEKTQLLLNKLSVFESFINKNFPIFEKGLFLSMSDSLWGINKLQKFLNDERKKLWEIHRAFESEDEEYFEKIDYSRFKKNGNYLKFIKQWLYQRFHFRLLLKKKSKREGSNKKNNNPFYWNNKRKFSGRYLLRLMMNPLFTMMFILIPFITHIISPRYSSILYSGIAYSAIIFFIITIISFILQKTHLISFDESETIRYSDFFFPKMFALILIAYLTMFVVDEMWAVTISQNWIYGIIMLVTTLIISYWIIDVALFSKMNFNAHQDKKNKKKQRIWNIISIGLFESFIINLFNAILLTAKMSYHTRANFVEVFQKFPPLLGENASTYVLLFGKQFQIYPYMILIWTFQVFSIGVILQIFIQKDKITS